MISKSRERKEKISSGDEITPKNKVEKKHVNNDTVQTCNQTVETYMKECDKT